MSEDVWTERDTTPDAIDAALREMLRERHAANQALVPARVLNLVVVVDRSWKGEIANRLERVGRYHASRTILCAVEPGRTTMDARVVMSYEEPSDDGLGVILEQVEIDLGDAHLPNLESVIDPIRASEIPTMIWAPHGHSEAVNSLLEITDVILLDSDGEPDTPAALARAAELLESVYVVDLAWLRTTPWRERLAATFDPPVRRGLLCQIGVVAARHQATSTASASLLAGWLASRLGWAPSPLTATRGDLRGVARAGDREVEIELDSSDQLVPGLTGVTVAVPDGWSLSLDRASGGLCAWRRSEDGTESTWKVLGASRGEGGILGEGVRQALLRDPTYGPALSCALMFCPVGVSVS
ncbi:MAG TPA: glucose-6-phosphate dehydrogenase assembly protein OpcA [Solirubrobacteraceae bacterium]|nr:glucose-6-phosphate dehydrogenase assembly protein OpcA [Solirubrobacteraceae bacterium]